jgi:CRISPR/Cas system CSM-associated protein Csm3 (group 7 of RAMP superfamily)
MTDMEITWKWKVTAPLHIGNGFSRAGFVDRCVRVEKEHAVIPSEAVKGAIRGAGEQLARWLGATVKETEDASFPRIPVLRRIFAPSEDRRFYRFRGCISEQPVKPYTLTSTKIDPGTRVALDNTLRTIELLPRGATFLGRVQLLAGEWDDSAKCDSKDLLFLLVAIVSTEGIGGKKGSGLGRLQCLDLCANGKPYADILTKLEVMQSLRELVKEGCKDADPKSAVVT